MTFVDRVIEDLKAGRHERATPNEPVGKYGALGPEMLFSENYDEDYSFNRDNSWHININYDPITLVFRKTSLTRGNIKLPLTKAERKALYKAYCDALGVEQERYLERLYNAQR